jgi:polysaccharide biosynthesis/export protein
MIKTQYALVIPLAIFVAAASAATAQTVSLPVSTVDSGSQSQDSKASSLVSAASRFESSAEERHPNRDDLENARKCYKAGVKYGRANLFRQALQSFQEALKYDPEYADAYLGLGQAYLDLGNFRESVDAFEKVIKLNPKSADAQARRAEAYAKLKDQKQDPRVPTDSGSGEKVALVDKPRPVVAAPLPVPATTANDTSTEKPNLRNELTRIYKVGIGDVLDVRITGVTNSDSTLFTVSSSGLLEYPILQQPLRVLGLTTTEISETIGAELKRRSMGQESDAQVGVRDYNSHTILVSGLVKEPGTKILRREAIPLYVVLADAQPLPEAGQVTVITQGSAKSHTFELSDPDQASLLVLPGDVVTVNPPVKQFFYVGGEVKSPGEFQFHRGLTLTQAIFSAGGVTPRGEKVQLTRGRGNEVLTMKEFKLKAINKGSVPDPLVEPGDRILVLH